MNVSLEDRIPPGQTLVTDFPVLHEGRTVHLAPADWTARFYGLIDPAFSLDWKGLLALPFTDQVCDLHCVTGWTKLDTRWRGVRLTQVLARSNVLPDAQHVLVHAAGGWTTNLPVEELLRDDVLLAYEYEGRPLPPEHGGPVRLLVPRLYFWKSAKWVEAFEFLAEERLGFWETRGYHRLGDPWLEQRYS